MAKVILISCNNEYKNALEGFDFNVESDFNDTIFNPPPEIILLDSAIQNSKISLLNLVSKNSSNEFDIFYLANENEIQNLPANVKIILKPLNKAVLVNEINLALIHREQIKSLHNENLELKKNLYQIDAFYNASSKFAGTLDKEKLYEVLFETLERVLSFDASCALVNDNFANDNLKFYIHSLKKVTENLNDKLIRRLGICAKNEGLSSIKPERSKVETVQYIKPSYKNDFLDLAITNYDSLFAPILIKDRLEGIIEVFRKTPFTKEDITCFQSIVHQVLAPLRSAILYEDIINKNIELKKLEQIKSEFVSIVSHELRTPITPINNALSIILSEKGGEIGEVNKNFANIAKRNVLRLSGIIEDLLDLSRMQTGKFDFKFKKTEIAPSLELAASTFKNQAASKNIAFEINYENNLPEVYIDPHRIDQIISNLITNAIKFTNEGGKITLGASLVQNINPDILISPFKKEYEGKYIKISVKDTGIGIEKEDIPKIFDKFSQIENTLSRNTGGIGLGLTITKHFIDAHLGGIWVDSKKNEGSCFNFIIPVFSDYSAYMTELNFKIKKEACLASFKITEPLYAGFYDTLKELNIIKLTGQSKELTVEKEGKKTTHLFIPGLEKNAYEFMVSKIEEEINLKDYDIVLSKAYYRKDMF